ncbi:MAG TPA: hypothetical protein VG225_12975 [Terracidiphilus sp.]|jgi:hypothetical protein|nr:hypothetical protein [Terracidiphilus sp.]
MTRRKWLIFGVVAGVFLALFWTVAARHQTPAGQPPLADLTHQSLSQLRQEFNAAPDSERVLLLLSPTCPVCIKGSSVLNAVLKSHPGTKIRVFAIWEPILPTDWGRPASTILGNLSDERVLQWWDKRHLVAHLLRESAGGRDPGCCMSNGTLWDVIAVYPPGARWTETLPAPQFFAGPVVRGAPQWDAKVTGNDSRADSSRP